MDKLPPLPKGLEGLFIYFGISLFMAFAVLLVVESWRQTKSYFLAAVIFGTGLGLAVSNIHIFSINEFAFLAAIFGTVTGPITLARMQGMSFTEAASKAAKDMQDVVTAINAKNGKKPPE